MGGRHLRVAVSLFLVACSPSAPNWSVTAGNASPTTTVVTSNHEVSSNSAEKASVFVNHGNANGSFPIYAPRYPGALAASSMAFETSLGLVGTTIVMETPDERARVVAFYTNAAAEGGRKILMETISTRSTMIMVANAAVGEPDVAITVAEAGDGMRTIAISQQMHAKDSVSLRAARARVLPTR